MILHALELEGWQCFARRISVRLDSNRINVLYGSNGTGKSTLLWALIRALFDTHRAGGRSAEALRPWGTQLSPQVLVEFEHGGTLYRLKKSFLERRGARLERLQGKAFTPLAVNEKAEEHVREMLLAETPGPGLTKTTHWGLARALWCPQEELAVESLDGKVLGSIQKLLGAQALSKDGLALKSRIEALYGDFWTPTGRPKTGRGAPLFVRLEEDLRKARQALEDADAELEKLHAAQQEANRLQQEVAGREGRLQQLRKELAESQRKVNEYVSLLNEHQKLEAQYKNAQTQWTALQDRTVRISSLRRRLDEVASTRSRPERCSATAGVQPAGHGSAGAEGMPRRMSAEAAQVPG